jgi:membrane protease YdiL (CAAX protease family)
VIEPERMVQPTAEARPVRWGVGDAVVGWLVANFGAVVIGSAIIAAAGYTDIHTNHYPLWLIAVLQIPLWFGYLGSVLYAAWQRGNGLRTDFRAWSRPVPDLALGVVVGVACQFLLVPLVSLPWVKLLEHLQNKKIDLSKVARDLTDKANDPLGVVLLVLIVAIGAPFVEELFFRGLLLRSLERKWGVTVALFGSAIVFGATHFELAQLPALIAFGLVLAWLAFRFDRLGPSVAAHLSFNTASVILLLTHH